MESIIRFQRELLRQGAGAPAAAQPARRGRRHRHARVDRLAGSRPTSTRRRPHGVFELKFFFNSSIRTSDGDGIASESVKEKIRQIIKAEDPHNPLSDQRIAEMLSKESNIEIARRTVTKYREALRHSLFDEAQADRLESRPRRRDGKPMKLTDILVRDACRSTCTERPRSRSCASWPTPWPGRFRGSIRPSSTRCCSSARSSAPPRSATASRSRTRGSNRSTGCWRCSGCRAPGSTSTRSTAARPTSSSCSSRPGRRAAHICLLLARLSRLLGSEAFRARLLEVKSTDELFRALEEEETRT